MRIRYFKKYNLKFIYLTKYILILYIYISYNSIYNFLFFINLKIEELRQNLAENETFNPLMIFYEISDYKD